MSIEVGRAVSRNEIRLDIQGLRAVAVLAVMIFHADKTWLPGGFIGVDIFFVISGFLITSIVLGKKADLTFSFKEFYWGRINRIVPAYAVMLVAVTAVMAVILAPGDFKFYRSSLNKAIYFFSNVHFANSVSYFSPVSYELALQHTWSLAVEMQFYFFLPLALIFLPRHWLKVFFPLTVVALTAYACYWLYIVGERNSTYFSLLSRIPEFCIGVCTALIGPAKRIGRVVGHAPGAVGGLLIAVSLVLIDETTAFPGVAALFPCLGAALLIARPGGAVNRLLSVRGMVWIGDLSYSLYLWHWPVLAAIRYIHGDYRLDAENLTIFVLLTLALSYCSYRWVEKSFRINWVFPETVLKYVVLLVVLGVAASFSRGFNKKLVTPLPNEPYVDDSMCFNKITGNCYRGDLSSANSALFIGDSLAAHLNYFFDVVGSYNKFKVLSITTAGCLPLPGYDSAQAYETVRAWCAAQAAVVAPLIEQPGLVIVAGNWEGHMERSSFLDSLKLLLEKAKERGQTVFVLAQPPHFKYDPYRIYRLNQIGLSSPAYERMDGWEQANRTVATLVQQYPGARFIDMSHSDFFKDAPFHNGTLLYSDNLHFNSAGSHLFGEYAKGKFADFLKF